MLCWLCGFPDKQRRHLHVSFLCLLVLNADTMAPQAFSNNERQVKRITEMAHADIMEPLNQYLQMPTSNYVGKSNSIYLSHSS